MSTITDLLDPCAEAEQVRTDALKALSKEYEELHAALNKEHSEQDSEILRRRNAIYTAHDLACGKVQDTYRETIKALGA